MSASRPLRRNDPERLGRYRLLGVLGEGGQGTVYLGEDPDGGRVAVKLLGAGLGDDAEARARFVRELGTAKRVARFCTAAVLDADVEGDRPYIVSEHVDGPSLQHVVETEGPRSGGALERLAVGTATAMNAIHRAGVVHRDLKPHNVLLGPDGPRVIDFGIARALGVDTTITRGMVGTPAYMTPEQFAGRGATAASDVFAWAATLVYAATGRPPFGNDEVAAVITRVLHEEPQLGPLSGRLRDLAAECLAKDPARRPVAAEVLRRLLGEETPSYTRPIEEMIQQAAAESAPPPAPRRAPPPARRRAPQPARRRALKIGVAAAVSAGLLAAAVVLALSLLSGKDEKPRAFPSSYGGAWTGRLLQNDGKTPQVRLNLPAGEGRGEVVYPDQRCSGVLTVVRASEATVELRERITQGAGNCIDSGSVTLTRQGDGSLLFNYTGTEGGRTFTDVGRVRRP